MVNKYKTFVQNLLLNWFCDGQSFKRALYQSAKWMYVSDQISSEMTLYSHLNILAAYCEMWFEEFMNEEFVNEYRLICKDGNDICVWDHGIFIVEMTTLYVTCGNDHTVCDFWIQIYNFQC